MSSLSMRTAAPVPGPSPIWAAHAAMSAAMPTAINPAYNAFLVFIFRSFGLLPFSPASARAGMRSAIEPIFHAESIEKQWAMSTRSYEVVLY
jgi:hypothetical protein